MFAVKFRSSTYPLPCWRLMLDTHTRQVNVGSWTQTAPNELQAVKKMSKASTKHGRQLLKSQKGGNVLTHSDSIDLPREGHPPQETSRPSAATDGTEPGSSENPQTCSSHVPSSARGHSRRRLERSSQPPSVRDGGEQLQNLTEGICAPRQGETLDAGQYRSAHSQHEVPTGRVELEAAGSMGETPSRVEGIGTTHDARGAQVTPAHMGGVSRNPFQGHGDEIQASAPDGLDADPGSPLSEASYATFTTITGNLGSDFEVRLQTWMKCRSHIRRIEARDKNSMAVTKLGCEQQEKFSFCDDGVDSCRFLYILPGNGCGSGIALR